MEELRLLLLADDKTMKQTLLRTPPKTSGTEGQPQQGYQIRGTILRPPLQPDRHHRAFSDIKPTAARRRPPATAPHSLAQPLTSLP